MTMGLLERSSGLSELAKRLFDILTSALVLLLLSPFFGIIAWAIKRDTPGQVLYRGRRAGRSGKEFNILKFRSMREEAASYAGPPLTAEDDPRITPVGKWLRQAKLNELPQLPTHAQHLLGRVLPYPQGASRKGRYAVAKAYSVGCAEALW